MKRGKDRKERKTVVPVCNFDLVSSSFLLCSVSGVIIYCHGRSLGRT